MLKTGSLYIEFIDANPQYLTTPSQMEFLTDDGGKDYNHCHFWSNFEVSSSLILLH